MNSIFKELSSVDVSGMSKTIGGNANKAYLPWSNAIREVLKAYPNARWEFTLFDGLPFLKTECGYFVQAEMTIAGIHRVQMMPVLNHMNKVIEKPNAFDINKSQMRALAKVIALHGLGLDLWAGEDLYSDTESPKRSNKQETINDEQCGQLSYYCVSMGENGAEWTPTGQKMLKAYNITNINQLPSSKFSEALARAEKHANNS